MPTADEIRLALSLYSTDATVERNSADPPTLKALDGLQAAGLLDECQSGVYEGNEALTMWVEALALVPFPVRKWVLPPFTYPKAYED